MQIYAKFGSLPKQTQRSSGMIVRTWYNQLTERAISAALLVKNKLAHAELYSTEINSKYADFGGVKYNKRLGKNSGLGYLSSLL